jgi:hypothetical protein
VRLNGKTDFAVSASFFFAFSGGRFPLDLTFGGLISYNLFFSTDKQSLVLCEGDKSQ